MTSFKLEIVTAEKLVYTGYADILVVPGVDGELAVLPGHAPLLTLLKPGEMRVVEGDKENHIAVSGGFIEVLNDEVSILADTAERAEEIDIDRAEAALKQARDRIESKTSDMDLEKALASLRRSEARLIVAKRRHRRSETMVN